MMDNLVRWISFFIERYSSRSDEQHDHSQAHSYIFPRCQRDAAVTKTFKRRMQSKLNEIWQCIYQFVAFHRPEGWKLAERRNRLICWQKSAVSCQHKSRHDCWQRTLTMHWEDSLCCTDFYNTTVDFIKCVLPFKILSIIFAFILIRHIFYGVVSFGWISVRWRKRILA